MPPTQRVLLLSVLCFTACADNNRDDNGTPRDASTNNIKKPDASSTQDLPTTGADSGSASTCPVARPAEGNSCQRSTALCSYDEIECRCPSGVWSCEEPVNPDCPTSTPAEGSTCALPEATECDYLTQECECLSGVWSCQAEGEEEQEGDASLTSDGGAQTIRDGGVQTIRDGGVGDAGGCPEGRPAELASCAAGSQMCTYESTTCVCPEGVWSCSEPVARGCPETTPLHGDACSGSADCDFLEVECECLRGAWSCKKND
jgi:hypothetical protein